MKTLFTFFFGLTFLLGLSAQSGFEEMVDSLGQLPVAERIQAFSQTLADQTFSRPEQTARLHHELGKAYSKAEEFLQAETQMEQALAIRLKREAEAPDDVLVSAFNLGSYRMKMAAYEQAIDAFQLILDRAPNRKVGPALHRLGNIYTKLGEYELADKAFQNAGEMEPWTDSPFRRALLLCDWSELYLVQDNPEAATQAIQKLQAAYQFALEAEEADGPELAATILNSLGMAYTYAGQYGRAIQTLHQAIHQHKICCEEQSFSATIYTNLGIAFRRKGDLAKALAYHQKALPIYLDLAGEKMDIALAGCYDNLATTLLHLEQPENSLDYLQKALYWSVPGFSSERLKDNPTVDAMRKAPNKAKLLIFLRDKAEAWEKMADHAAHPKAYDQAVSTYLVCDQLIDLMREDHLEQATKLLWREQARRMYQSAVEICQRSNRPKAAFYFSEKSRAVLLLDDLRERNARAQLPLSVRNRLYSLSAKIHYLQQSLPDASDEKQKLLQQQLILIQQHYLALQDSIETAYPDYFNLKFQPSLIDADELQARLKKHETLVEYFLADQFALALVIDQDQVRMVVLPKPSEWASQVRPFITGLKKYHAPYPTAAAIKLYQTIIEPLQLIPNHEITIIPDGLLSLIPFEALLSDRPPANSNFQDWPFLLKQFQINYAFSANHLFFAANTPHNGNGKVLALAPMAKPDPAYGVTPALELAQSGFMIEKLAGILPTEAYFGRQATRSCFQNKADHFSVLHLATHAYLNHQQPAFTRFLLADADEEARNFYASDLYNHHFNADLVVLSACETGTGQLQYGEGVASLGRAFAHNGAPNLSMSLWPVDDGSTATLMALFYENLKEGKGKGAALQHAKLEYIQQAGSPKLGHPYFWAGFVYYGDREPLQLGKGVFPPKQLLTVAGIGLLLLVVFRWRKDS